MTPMPSTSPIADRVPNAIGFDPEGSTLRILSCLAGTGRIDRVSHLRWFGPLPIPRRHDPAWAQRTVADIAASGLTGRGGAGFPSARKLDGLRAVRRSATIVVNAMEGEPASAKDRTLLTGTPHLVLDGAEVVAATVGARRILVCIAENQRASIAAVRGAVAERRGSGAHTDVATPAAGFVAGEESALVAWLGSGEALPAFRPDKSQPLRLRRSPVLVHNAETLAHVALIARYGPGWFRRVGTDDAPGTTLVTLSGGVRRPGVVEVPLGTPVRRIVAAAEPVGALAAALVGGFGGAWLPAASFDVPYTPGALAAAGAVAGAGVVVTLPAGACGVTETARVARYMAGESAGQCGPCVFGLPAVAADLEVLAAGHGHGRLLERLTGRLDAVDGRGACRHPDGVVRMVRSALRVFADDVAAHAAGRPCPSATGRQPRRPAS